MKKLIFLFIISASLLWCQNSQAITGRVLVYKGVIKASNTIFDDNDTSHFLPGNLKGYWIIDVAPQSSIEYAPYKRGELQDSIAIIYDTKNKNAKLAWHDITINPYDPCGIIMVTFYGNDPDGSIELNLVGKGKLTSYSNADGATKDYVATILKGTGVLVNLKLFDPIYTLTGPVTVTWTLDMGLTREANVGPIRVDDVMEDIADALDEAGYTFWPSLNPFPQ